MALLNSIHFGSSTSPESPRTHRCSVFKGESEQFAAVVPHIVEGIRRNDRCVYISDRFDRGDLFEILADAADLSEEVLEAKIMFLRTDDVYLKDGRFDKERMLGYLSDVYAQALKDGFSGLTVTGEMSWATRDVPGASELIEYEARVNSLPPGMSVSFLCQYSEPDFDPATLVKAVMAHPEVFVRGTLCINPYYLPPETLISFDSGEVTPEVLNRMEKELFSRSVLREIAALESKELRRARISLSVLDDMILGDFKDRLSALSFSNELALGACKDAETMVHIRSAGARCTELSERLEALRMFRSCMEAAADWQSLSEIVSSAVDQAVGGSRTALIDIGAYNVYASKAAHKAVAALVAAVAERSPSANDIHINASPSEYGLTARIWAEGPGVADGAKESLFDKSGPCVCGRSLCLAREVLESSGLSVREVGVAGKSTVFEIVAPASRYRGA